MSWATFDKAGAPYEEIDMTITTSVVADFVAGRLDSSHARAVEAAAARECRIAAAIIEAREHARRVRGRLLKR